MKPLYITLKNYKSYGNDETTIDLRSNAVRLLVGRNGNGKTTFVDAIVWCLYGTSLCNADEVVNRKTKKDCKAEFGFMVGNDEYNIIRYRKHETHKNKVLIFKNKKNVSPVKTQEAQALINEIIGIGYQAMVSSVIFSSEIYSSFLRAKGVDRLKIFEGILSLREVNKWAEGAKKLRKPIAEKLDELLNKREQIKVGVETIQSNISDYKKNALEAIAKLKVEKGEILEFIKEQGEKRDRYSHIDYTSEIQKNLQREVVLSKNKEINEAIKEETGRLHDISELVSKSNKLKSNLDELKRIHVEAELTRIDEYDMAVNHNKDIKDRTSLLEREIINLATIERDRNRLAKELASIHQEIGKVHTSICPTCGQATNDDINKRLISGYTEKANVLEAEMAENEIKFRDAESNNTEVKEKISKLQESLVDVPTKPEHTREQLSKVSADAGKLEKEIGLLDADIISKDTYNKEINERVKELKKKLVGEIPDSSEYKTEFLTDLETTIKEINDSIKASNDKIELINARAQTVYDKTYVEGLEDKNKKLIAADKKNNKAILDKEKEDKHYAFMLSLLSNKDSGIKRYVISKMVGHFNEKINHYLPLFFDYSVEIKFDKGLNETIIVEGEEVSFATFSSGEKTRLDLAIAFSLFMLVKAFFSSSVSFIVFDEILDANLDKEGVESIINVIKSLGDTNSIVVISHREEYKESFSNRILVKKNRHGFSHIEEEVA